MANNQAKLKLTNKSRTQTRPKAAVDDPNDINNKNVFKYGATQPGVPFGVTENNNWTTDRVRDWTNFVGELANPTRRNVIGSGYGDYLMGANPNDKAAGLLGRYRNEAPSKFPQGVTSGTNRDRPMPSGDQGMPGEPEKTLADYLRMAQEMIGSGGGGGIPMANYDPQRNSLRQQGSENDARLEAMYRQLRGSIDADAPVLQQGYQQAIDSTDQNFQTAQSQTQAATDSANARNNEVLANLGIQQAQGNAIQQGTDLNTQTAQQIAGQAAKGQAAKDRLVSNQATAMTHNTNIGNAAGLEGNLQRAANNARLQALLAEIDMQEGQDNASRAAQNASLSQNGLGRQLELAQWLMGNATDERRYQDSLSMDAAKMVQGQGQAYDPNAILDFYNQLMNNGFLSKSDDPRTQIDAINMARQLYKP